MNLQEQINRTKTLMGMKPLNEETTGDKPNKNFCSAYPNSVYGEGVSMNENTSYDKAYQDASLKLSQKIEKESFSSDVKLQKVFKTAEGSYRTKLFLEERI
jgi:hypothetical protein